MSTLHILSSRVVKPFPTLDHHEDTALKIIHTQSLDSTPRCEVDNTIMAIAEYDVLLVGAGFGYVGHCSKFTVCVANGA